MVAAVVTTAVHVSGVSATMHRGSVPATVEGLSMAATAVAAMECLSVPAAMHRRRMSSAMEVFGMTAMEVFGMTAAVKCFSMSVMPRNIVSTARSLEPVASPSMAIAPVSPRSNAKEDAVVEVTRAVIAIRSAGIRRVVVIAVRTRRRRADTDSERHLSIDLRGNG